MTGARALPAAARAVVRGDRRALAQLITRIEARDPTVAPILRALHPRTGHAKVVGLTGPLGVGKSSLVNVLLAHLRAHGTTVAVVAVDPSSPFSGGSVLGDRIRLERDPSDAGVFIRSMASRGRAGGVASATREVVRLLDAAGYDVVLVETVGSGQVDIEIRDVASTNVVVLVPHLGDEVQSLKAGLFEIADVFCVNKADLPGADAAARDLSELASLGTARDGWRPVVVQASARDRTGVDELWTAIAAHEAFLDAAPGRRAEADRRRVANELDELVRDRVAHEAAERHRADPSHGKLLDAVVARRLDPRTAADRIYANRRRRPTRVRRR
ncbi:MAG: methylmalonyl Co-A mutase-associated GTPase MeaB [Thermoplasmata archaeon]|nr:methylmalonyl Co-A mutase-associated GTPase MeaB [Thermoplasmata archaeon]